MRRWLEAELPAPYAMLERLRQETAAAGGAVTEVDYGAEVTLKLLLPEEAAEAYRERVYELSAGSLSVRITGESFRAAPRERKKR